MTMFIIRKDRFFPVSVSYPMDNLTLGACVATGLGVVALFANFLVIPALLMEIQAFHSQFGSDATATMERLDALSNRIDTARVSTGASLWELRKAKRQLMDENCPDGKTPAKKPDGSLVRCGKEKCPKTHYCTFSEISFQRVCCPKKKPTTDQCFQQWAKEHKEKKSMTIKLPTDHCHPIRDRGSISVIMACKPENKCPPGPAGPRGAPGKKGLPGLDGEDGWKGPDAVDIPSLPSECCCTACPKGPRGGPGAKGDPGPDGKKGKRGPPGKGSRKGPPGPPGPNGPSGPRGKNGPKGKIGPPGKPSQKIIGKPGPKGKPGPIGKPGDRGPKGKTGKLGKRGKQGPPGPDEPKGPPGKQGPPGPTGPPGKPGFDAHYCPCPNRVSGVQLNRRIFSRNT